MARKIHLSCLLQLGAKAWVLCVLGMQSQQGVGAEPVVVSAYVTNRRTQACFWDVCSLCAYVAVPKGGGIKRRR